MMHIVFFSNPDFFGSEKRPGFSSMPRFTNMLVEGMTQRGHKISIWSPGSLFFNMPLKGVFKKYMGYVDQYILFPIDVGRRLKECNEDTLFVFTDQAQGPWIKLVKDRKHVMHCHDFLAQLAALGKLADEQPGWTGKRYQQFIRNGYLHCKNFISGSSKTKEDLLSLLPKEPDTLKVVYNGLDQSYAKNGLTVINARIGLSNKIDVDLTDGYVLHIGGNQWYKNRLGVIEIYNSWRTNYENTLPLILIGAAPSAEIIQMADASPFTKDIHFISGLSDLYIRNAYTGASVFLFPSLAEGFGWPIAEAMGCGSLVIITDAEPMTEVAGGAAFLIPLKTAANTENWSEAAAAVMNTVITLPDAEREEYVARSVLNSKRFDPVLALDQIEDIYKNISLTHDHIN